MFLKLYTNYNSLLIFTDSWDVNTSYRFNKLCSLCQRRLTSKARVASAKREAKCWGRTHNALVKVYKLWSFLNDTWLGINTECLCCTIHQSPSTQARFQNFWIIQTDTFFFGEKTIIKYFVAVFIYKNVVTKRGKISWLKIWACTIQNILFF